MCVLSACVCACVCVCIVYDILCVCARYIYNGS